MECSEPGAIRDEELLAYMDGAKVRPAVLAHLARCQYCSSQLAAYQRIDRKLTQRLYRWDCPTNQILGEYQLGLLSGEQAAEADGARHEVDVRGSLAAVRGPQARARRAPHWRRAASESAGVREVGRVFEIASWAY